MELNIYSIFDSAAKAYTQPFFMQNDGMAIRAFQSNVNAKENNISEYPDQFTLYRIGTFDDSTGQVKQNDPESLGNGMQYKTEKTYTAEDIKQLIKEVVNNG